MRPFNREWLESQGFSGFCTFNDIEQEGFPGAGGVYVVLHNGDDPVRFLSVSTGGWFKGRDPTVDPAILELKWIAATPVIYIGKATNLKTRLGQLRAFGMGKAVGHWGGRYIWQVQGANRHRLAWKVTDKVPREAEQVLLASFVAEFGHRPFANIVS